MSISIHWCNCLGQWTQWGWGCGIYCTSRSKREQACFIHLKAVNTDVIAPVRWNRPERLLVIFRKVRNSVCEPKLCRVGSSYYTLRSVYVKVKENPISAQVRGGPNSDKISFGTPKNCLNVHYALISRQHMSISIHWCNCLGQWTQWGWECGIYCTSRTNESENKDEKS